jgi:RNA polymerase sigma-70 factor, ECF subfamily
VRDVVERVLALLSQEERKLLRLHFAQGLTIDQLGLVYDVHRSTTARWIASARAKILRELQQHALDQGLLSAGEPVSTLLDSQLHLSLERWLEPRDGEP